MDKEIKRIISGDVKKLLVYGTLGLVIYVVSQTSHVLYSIMLAISLLCFSLLVYWRNVKARAKIL